MLFSCNSTQEDDEELIFQLINDGKEYAVLDIGVSNDKNIVIPSKYNGKPVTEIYQNAFKGSEIVSVNIPKSVKIIGEGAFEECRMLKSVTIAAGTEIIKERAFYQCSNLLIVEMPNTITEIEENALSDCRNITSIKYGGTVEQWNAIDKAVTEDVRDFLADQSWDAHTRSYTVYCTDGEIVKK